uniref:Uncharacterized protein n=1 Tax=Eutreptiella gymnastica TaxID=73025 RepID=A0A7S1I859_9EUGL|mmetsp:Transcript_136872/g.237821  ORF Transcript_136872/g.237821 Transcript_136872/m.237821 type:complete len:137 (+) Transcript_136872:152-562(+)
MGVCTHNVLEISPRFLIHAHNVGMECWRYGEMENAKSWVVVPLVCSQQVCSSVRLTLHDFVSGYLAGKGPCWWHYYGAWVPRDVGTEGVGYPGVARTARGGVLMDVPNWASPFTTEQRVSLQLLCACSAETPCGDI